MDAMTGGDSKGVSKNEIKQAIKEAEDKLPQLAKPAPVNFLPHYESVADMQDPISSESLQIQVVEPSVHLYNKNLELM